jgi:hypothetical protein
MDGPLFEFRQGQEIFRFSNFSRLARQPAQFSIEWAPAFFAGCKAAGASS